MKEKDLIKRISSKRTMSFAVPQLKEDDRVRKKTIWNDNTQKEESSGNINNILSQSRLTNTFGNFPEEKLEEFFNIDDDFQ